MDKKAQRLQLTDDLEYSVAFRQVLRDPANADLAKAYIENGG
jgi:hypothetical protein